MLKKFIFAAAHLIFWAVFISLSLQVGFRVSQGWDLFLSLYPVYLIHLLWAATAVYLFYFRLADILLESRRAVKFLLVTIIASPVIAMVYFSLIYLFFPDIRQLMTFRLYAGSTMTTYIMTLLGTLLKAFVNWYNAQEEKTELEKTRLQNELALLRNQVNPHFLFNTLNNIDSLIRTDADKASKAIIKLSEIMRYMLYETDQDYVTLGQEKKYLEDFIGLQRLRHKTADAIEFLTSIKDIEVKIVPFLMVPFVENAFKFATRKGSEPLVSIELCDDSKQLVFTCINHYNPGNSNQNRTGGLGIKNMKQRLAAYYKDRHELIIEKKHDLYRVELRIRHADQLHHS